MIIPSLVVCFVCFVALSHSAPSRVKYDQRQEGDLNVRADLENFVILVIPTNAGASPSTLGLLDLLSKAIPMRSNNKRQKTVRRPVQPTPSLLEDSGEVDALDDTQSFIESKTAPYHVDITKSRKNLAKLHPKTQDGGQEELLVSPNLSLIKAAEEEDAGVEHNEDGTRQGRMLRLSKGFVLSMPLEVEEDLVKIDNKRIEKSKDTIRTESKETKKKVGLVKGKDKPAEPKLKLLLLGAEHDEECGPGYARDDNGVCIFLAHV